MKKLWLRLPSALLAGALLLATGVAQKPSGAKGAQAAKHLSVDDVIAMASAGVSDDVIIARLARESQGMDLSTADLIRLKQAKVGDPVLKAMLDPKAVAAAPAASAQPVPQQVVVQPASYLDVRDRMLGVSRSGATPAPGATSTADPNDPLTPHDSGIYLYTKDRDGKPQMVLLERAAYTGAKTGGLFASAVTYGIAKVKTKAQIPGLHASIRVSDPSPVFYFYFEDKQAGLDRTSMFGVGNLSNPNQFALLKLETGKSFRETTIGEFSSFGASSGSDSKAMIQFKSERLRNGLYKVVVDGMKSGEYCFLAAGPSLGAGRAGAYGAVASAADIFDFGVGLE